MTLTFTYANSTTPIAGVKVIMTESDGTVTVLVTDANGQITLPSTNNTYTLSASLAETGEDPISLIDAIHILQYGGELRTLTANQLKAADINDDGEVDLLDAWGRLGANDRDDRGCRRDREWCCSWDRRRCG